MAASQSSKKQFMNFAKSVCSFEGSTFVVDPRYEIRCRVGQGAQGIICSAVDLKSPTRKEVAVKKLPNALDEIMSCKRLLRELRLLRHLRHENILSLIDIMLPPSSNVLMWKDVYIVSELMDTDLAYVISSGQLLTNDHVQFFTHQLLNGLAYLHKCNVVHRDLKPGNILVDRNCTLKICDFGLARSCTNDKDEVSQQLLTMYVTTRWYRAPELLCFNDSYGAPVDMWSAGCIIAELFARKALFQGTDPRNQLEQIVRVIGAPEKEDLSSIINEGALQFIASLPPSTSCLDKVLENAPPQALDLVRRLFCFTPANRLTALQALEHPYIASYYDAKVEAASKSAKETAMISEWLTITGISTQPKEQLQNLIFQEMLQYHPEVITLPWGAAQPG